MKNQESLAIARNVVISALELRLPTRNYIDPVTYNVDGKDIKITTINNQSDRLGFTLIGKNYLLVCYPNFDENINVFTTYEIIEEESETNRIEIQGLEFELRFDDVKAKAYYIHFAKNNEREKYQSVQLSSVFSEYIPRLYSYNNKL